MGLGSGFVSDLRSDLVSSSVWMWCLDLVAQSCSSAFSASGLGLLQNQHLLLLLTEVEGEEDENMEQKMVHSHISLSFGP